MDIRPGGPILHGDVQCAQRNRSGWTYLGIFPDEDESEKDEDGTFGEIGRQFAESRKGDINGSVFTGESPSASADLFNRWLSVLRVSRVIGNQSKCWDRESFAIGRPVPGTGVTGSSVKKTGGGNAERGFSFNKGGKGGGGAMKTVKGRKTGESSFHR